MGGSLLFTGLDPLAGNPNMFSRNPLSRPTPLWAPNLSLDNSVPSAPAPNRPQQQPNASLPQSRNSQSREKSRSAVVETAPAPAPGSTFNYNVQGLAPSTVAGGTGTTNVAGNDALSSSLYERHRGVPQAPSSASSLPPPAHQGSSLSAHHQYAAASGNHHFGPGAAGLNMAPTFGDLQPPPPHPHHPLAEHAQSSALYQQLLQQHRQQEELLLRNPHHPSMMLHQPGLLGSPATYPPTFSSGLSLQQPFQGWL